MLLRAQDGHIEVFMLRRSSHSAFGPDAYVFPGGTLEDRDLAARLPDSIAPRLHESCTLAPKIQRALVVTVVRETFEECGVRVDARDLELFSHWTTPESEPRRYDVHFFLAAAPIGQQPVADAVETHDGMWIDPHTALARNESGSLALMYPTRKHLERLRDFKDLESALSFSRTKPIRTICVSEKNNFALPQSLEAVW
jgi:8-oxo-dGTP pyrophosphatase MutT (NUDIX family)